MARCRAWASRRRKAWKEVEKACRWNYPRAPSVRNVFGDGRVTEAVLTFLGDTEVVTTTPPERGCGKREG